jgi:putative PIN family toxin of toxin-antitoxin system
MIERVVFDTSTLVGAALKVGSKPHRPLMLGLSHCVLCCSDELIAELEKVLNRGYFGRYPSQPARNSFVAMTQKNAKTLRVAEIASTLVDPPCRDVSDNFILALALAAEPDAIISSDYDLLSLHPGQKIFILMPAQFVHQFASEKAL